MLSRGGAVWEGVLSRGWVLSGGGKFCQTGSDIPCGQTDMCKNITLPQTSFAGGN